MVIVAIVCGALTTVIGTAAKEWRKAREAEMEASLKVELIKQGRSPEEIERVRRVSGKSN
jgi:hypothetical protein